MAGSDASRPSPWHGKQAIAQRRRALRPPNGAIGRLISDAMGKPSATDGVITVEQSKTITTGTTTAEGHAVPPSAMLSA